VPIGLSHAVRPDLPGAAQSPAGLTITQRHRRSRRNADMESKTFSIASCAGTKLVAAALAVASSSSHAASFQLVPGDIYTTDSLSSAIIQTRPDGNEVSTLTLSRYTMGYKGLAFAPDDTLYVVAVTTYGYDVVHLGADGSTLGTYPGSTYVSGNLSYGKIAVSDSGRVYVAGQSTLMSLMPGISASTPIYTDNQIFDLDFLPSGNLLVVTAYHVVELTPTGTLVREVLPSHSVVDGHGIKVERATNTFVTTMLGYTDHYHELRRWDLATGALLGWNVYNYADDIDQFPDGRLLIGSRSLGPGIFDIDLGMTGALNAHQRMFVAIHSNPIFGDGFGNPVTH
jgi:hypothetical protein